jgi:hypothetical protein
VTRTRPAEAEDRIGQSANCHLLSAPINSLGEGLGGTILDRHSCGGLTASVAHYYSAVYRVRSARQNGFKR